MKRQALENQTLYAELLEQLQALEAMRNIGALEGSFVEKKVKGTRYVYFQHYDAGGSKRQIYVGRKTAELDQLVSVYRSERKTFSQDVLNIQRLCAQLRAGDALVTDHASARIVRQLSESGVFRLGGVLVGTQAYVILGNVLGVRWEHAATRTRDIDIATLRKQGETDVALAVPQVDSDIPRTLESLEMGFFPVPQLDGRQPSTSFMIRGKALRVDILTPTSRQQSAPVYISRFKVAAQPLRFLDYLMEETIQAALINGGGTLVNVPSPARYAVHKLIVAQERGVELQAKKEKDLFQASQLISFLEEERPGDVRRALEAAAARGAGWRKRVERGMEALERKYGLTVK